MTPLAVCWNCRKVDRPLRRVPGSFWWELLAWVVWVPLGLVYSASRYLRATRNRCRRCGGEMEAVLPEGRKPVAK